MKIFAFILFLFTFIYASGQQLTSEVQAKRGIFTDRLYLNGKWIDGISANLATGDSSSDEVLPTAKAISDYIRLRTGKAIPNQHAASIPAHFWLQGAAVIGSQSYFKRNLTSGYPAEMYVTQNGLQHGLSVQRSSLDRGAATIELFKNNAAGFDTMQALQPGDTIGSISFSGITGNNSRVGNAMRLYGRVEKTAPNYVSSGFVFGATTDTGGISWQRMYLNAQGNLLLGWREQDNEYRLNVGTGTARFGSLTGNDFSLLGSDNNGVLRRIGIGNNLIYFDGYLYLDDPGGGNQDPYHIQHVGQLHQSGTDAPNEIVLEGASFQWARVAPGVYTATTNDSFSSGFTWFKSGASDQDGNAVYTKLYQSSTNTFTLVVKDANMNNTDNWDGISIEVRQYMAL